MTKVKIQESNKRLSVTIPKAICDMKGWTKGTELEVKEYSGNVCLIPVNQR